MKKYKPMTVKGHQIKGLFQMKKVPQTACTLTTMKRNDKLNEYEFMEFDIEPINPCGRVTAMSDILIKLNVHWTEPIPTTKTHDTSGVVHAIQRLKDLDYVYVGDDKYNRSIMIKIKDDGIKVDTVAIDCMGTLVHQYERTLI